MVTCCYYHPKVEGPETCRRCMIPLCADCVSDRYCPDCLEMAQYVRVGHTGKKQGNLVVQDSVRRGSLTRQLMINRLANNVLAEMPPVLPPARKAVPSRKQAKVRRTAPAVPVAASVVGILFAFSLGTFFARPPAQAQAPRAAAVEAVSEAAPASDEVADEVPIANRQTEYQVAEIGRFSASGSGAAARAAQPVNYAQPARQETDLVPSLPSAQRPGRVAYGYPEHRPHQLQALAALAEQPAVEVAEVPDLSSPARTERQEAAAPRPAVAMTWPVAGNTLRMTSFVKVQVTSPGQVSVLNVTVDGRTVAPLDAVAGRNEIAVDTTKLANGEHRIQVMAMTRGGDLITSDAVPVSVVN